MSFASILVVGAGVHGLSTAWHLAKQGEEVLVVDKTAIAAGASGIACGVVRNNYFQPAMSELMAACVEIWESDPEAFAYHGSGYIALGDGGQVDDLTTVFERQQQIGYPSQLILGEDEVAAHMRTLFDDWRAPGLSVCLHESAGGFAYIIGDRSGRIVTVEALAGQHASREVGPAGPLAWHTNHARYLAGTDAGPHGTSLARGEVLQALEIPPAEPDTAWFARILAGAALPAGVRADPSPGHPAMTLCTFVANLTTGEAALLGRGAGSATIQLGDLAQGRAGTS